MAFLEDFFCTFFHCILAQFWLVETILFSHVLVIVGEVNESYHLSAPTATSEEERVLGALEDEFGTRDFLGKTAELTTATERTGHNRLKKLAKDGVIEKVTHGRFKKVEPVG